MKEILIFAGTTEGRRLSECLAASEIPNTVCVATEYGGIVLKQHPLVSVRRGRMNQKEIETLAETGRFSAVVDATHPFAGVITWNIQKALEKVRAKGAALPCFRLKRDGAAERENEAEYFETDEACAEALERIKGNILLTTGSKNLHIYCRSTEVKNRLYVRTLPSPESLLLCMEQGICGKRIIAMQGPHTTEMNEAVVRQYGISCLVTKESGKSGGFPEKLEAAKNMGIRIFVIGRPEEEGDSFCAVCSRLEEISGKKIRTKETDSSMEVVLAGIGMGDAECMTKEAERAVCEADILLGSERLLKHLPPEKEKRPYYQPEKVIPFLQDIQEKYGRVRMPEGRHIKTVILFSGDSGFYSGSQPLYAALKQAVCEGRIKASFRILPGISSAAYLAARIGESYQDADVYSMHGKKLCGLAEKIRYSPKTFLLTSGVKDVNRLGELLEEAGLMECRIITGYQLSYREQRIERHTPEECRRMKEEGLYTCFVENPYAKKRRLTHGMRDREFIRDQVPMTKEEVREVCICKLHLRERAVVYDIGSGTGSVAVEMAGLFGEIQVFAVERKKAALDLIEKNKKKFRLQNITAVEAEAPEGLRDLPEATHAFIGGSGGRLKEILQALLQINPKMRIVISAASLETICEIKEILSMYPAKEKEILQIQVGRAEKMGKYHMMRAENPVWICAFDFAGEGREA